MSAIVAETIQILVIAGMLIWLGNKIDALEDRIEELEKKK